MFFIRIYCQCPTLADGQPIAGSPSDRNLVIYGIAISDSETLVPITLRQVWNMHHPAVQMPLKGVDIHSSLVSQLSWEAIEGSLSCSQGTVVYFAQQFRCCSSAFFNIVTIINHSICCIFICFDVHNVFLQSLNLLPGIYNFISISSSLKAVHVEFF